VTALALERKLLPLPRQMQHVSWEMPVPAKHHEVAPSAALSQEACDFPGDLNA
jgi:hypothetical protein